MIHGVTAGVVTVAFTVYVMMAAPGLTWLDGGELALAAATMGVAHPPGEPQYLILARLIALLPVGDLSFRLTLLSAMTVALSAGILSWLVTEASARIAGRSDVVCLFAGAASGLTFGLAPAAAVQAVRPELYGLSILLGLLAVMALKAGGPRGAVLALLPLSLLGAVHPVMLVAAAPGLVLLLAAPEGWRASSLRRLCISVGGAGLLALPALGLFAWLPLRSLAVPAFDFGTPQTWERFWWSFTGSTYARSFELAEGQLSSNVSAHLSLFASDLGLGVLFFAVAGAWALSSRSRSGVLAGLLLLVVGVLPTVLQGAFRPDNPDVRGYLLGPCAVLCGAAGLGLAALTRTVQDTAARAAGAVGAACCVALVIPPAHASLEVADRSQLKSPALLGAALLDAVPPGGLVLLGGDSWSFPTLYQRYWEGRRSDVSVIALHLTDEAALPALRHRGLPVPAALDEEERAALASAGSRAVPEQLARIFARHEAATPLLVNDAFLPPDLLARRQPMGLLYQLEPVPSPFLLELGAWEEERLWTHTVAPLRDSGLLASDPWARSVLTRRYASRAGFHRCRGEVGLAAVTLEQGASLDGTGTAMVHLLSYRLREGLDGVGPVGAGCPPPAGPWDASFAAGDDRAALGMLERPSSLGGASGGDAHWEARLALVRASARFLSQDLEGAAAELSHVLTLWPTHPSALLLQERLSTLGVPLPIQPGLAGPSTTRRTDP